MARWLLRLLRLVVRGLFWGWLDSGYAQGPSVVM